MRTTKICLSVRKVTADSVSGWLKKYFSTTSYHTTIVKGKIHEILMLQKIMEYLNTIKRHPGRIFMKFEKDEGSFEISF